MRKLATLLAVAAAGVLTACDPVAVIEQIVPVEARPSVPVDRRIDGGWYLYGRDDIGECGGLVSTTTLPCREVLNVCGDGGTTVWMPEVWRCTDASPRWRDVCATRPAVEWPYYGLTPQRCDELPRVISLQETGSSELSPWPAPDPATCRGRIDPLLTFPFVKWDLRAFIDVTDPPLDREAPAAVSGGLTDFQHEFLSSGIAPNLIGPPDRETSS